MRQPGAMNAPFQFYLAVVLALTAARPATAQWLTHQEKLVRPVPEGFVEKQHVTRKGVEFWQYVPHDQSGTGVTDLVSYEQNNARPLRPADFLAGDMAARWRHDCISNSHGNIADAVSNGYPVAMIRFNCDAANRDAKPTTALVRAILGADKIYVTMYEFRRAVKPEDIATAATFLESVTLCDTHSPQHPCPPEQPDPKR